MEAFTTGHWVTVQARPAPVRRMRASSVDGGPEDEGPQSGRAGHDAVQRSGAVSALTGTGPPPWRDESGSTPRRSVRYGGI